MVNILNFNKKLNLVYDNWNNEKNQPIYPNGQELYKNKCLLLDYWLNSFSISNENIYRYQLKDIEKYPDENFYYFISVLPEVMRIKLENNKNILSQEVIDNLKKNKNFIIIIINAQESESFETFNAIDKWSKLLKLNQNQLWISNNNTKLEEYKNITNSKINVHTSKFSISFVRNIFENFGQIEFNTKKEFLFLCHNKRNRPHRLGLLCLLKNYNILNDVDWSFIDGCEINDNFLDSVFSKEDIEKYTSEIEYFKSIKQKKSKYETEYNWFSSNNIDWNISNEKKTFENSYFNIATETNFYTNVIHITEKSFKPFYCLQFPLILASQNHISEIKKHYNFDFFDDIINHDYDYEINSHKRIIKFINEIKRIHENKEFFIDFYKKNNDRFINNYNKIINFNSDANDLEFLNKLTNRK